MDGITSEKVISCLKDLEVTTIVMLPDSRLADLEKKLRDDNYFTLIDVPNEGDGIAICSGLWMGGKKCIMMMEDSGIYEGTFALEKFGNMNEMPIVMLIGYHKPLSEGNWYQVSRTPITCPLLDTLRIPYVIIDEDSNDDKIPSTFAGAYMTANASQRPVGILCGVHIS